MAGKKQNFLEGEGVFVVGLKTLVIEGEERGPGDAVPEAFGWGAKARAMVDSGVLEWRSHPAEICPALEARLIELGWTPPAPPLHVYPELDARLRELGWTPPSQPAPDA